MLNTLALNPLNMYRIHIENHGTVNVNFEGDTVLIDQKNARFDLIHISGNHYHLLLNDRSFNAELLRFDRRNKAIDLKLNGIDFKMQIEDDFDLLLEKMGIERNAGEKVSEVLAPMPGLVLDILVQPGQTVEEGEALLVLEAMKMENVIKSPCKALIESVPVQIQDKIDKDQILIRFAG